MVIQLTLVSDIYDFIEVSQKHKSDVRLFQGTYVVDGKSILGVFTLDLRKPITCVVEDNVYTDFERFASKK